MVLELYINALSPFTRAAELQLEMKGVEFNRITPDREFVQGDAFRAVNPLRKIPVLMVDGTAVIESRVISDLIEELHPTPALLPESLIDRARVRMLATIAANYLATPGVQMFANKRDSNSPDIDADARSLLARGLAALEHWIAPGPYAAGEMRTVADCAVAPALFFLDGIMPKLGFGDLPEWGDKTKAYFAAVQKDADVGRCLADMDASLKQRLAQA